jgi:hypothetical protein
MGMEMTARGSSPVLHALPDIIMERDARAQYTACMRTRERYVYLILIKNI